MRRRVIAGGGAAMLVGAVLAAAAAGLPTNKDYIGPVKDAPGSVGFDTGKAHGHRVVGGFTVSNVEYTCDVGSDGVSMAMTFENLARIHKDGTFATDGQVFLEGSDPSGKLDGVIGHGKAHGTVKVKGELAGPDTDCKTGKLGWKAVKD